MVTKVVFPQGEATVTLEPMYQWDYGRKLEIDATGISTVVEVHFAHRGMTEAIAYTCSVKNNTITIPVPSSCLEQTNPILAWICENGITTREITIPIIQRTRPPKSMDIPQDLGSNVIREMNAVVDGLRDGSITAKTSETAKTATTAISAKNAENATVATSAVHATTASTATKAVQDSDGENINVWYLKNRMNYRTYIHGTAIDGGMMEFRVKNNSGHTASVLANMQGDGGTALFSITDTAGKNYVARLVFTASTSGRYVITVGYLNDSGVWATLDSTLYTIMYQYLSTVSSAGASVGPSGGVVKVGTSWIAEDDLANYTVTVTGGLSVYEDSMGWEVTAVKIGTGTVMVVSKSDGVIVSTTTYTIVEKTSDTGGTTVGTTVTLPEVSAADNGKLLGVMNGVYTLIDLGMAEGSAF